MNRAAASTMARAAMVAMEPLIDLFFEWGITAPEAESLLRSVMVHKARTWLSKQSGIQSPPSDAMVALVTGVHRNFVRKILADEPRIAAARQRKGRASKRMVDAWQADPLYLDNAGRPRDIPEKGSAPSFQALAAEYLPGASPSLALEELNRAGFVQMLPGHRLRMRTKGLRGTGRSLGAVAELGARGREFLESLSQNLRSSPAPYYIDSMATLMVEESRLPAIREIISRRAHTFLSAMEHELSSERRSAHSRAGVSTVQLGLTIFQS